MARDKGFEPLTFWSVVKRNTLQSISEVLDFACFMRYNVIKLDRAFQNFVDTSVDTFVDRERKGKYGNDSSPKKQGWRGYQLSVSVMYCKGGAV